MTTRTRARTFPSPALALMALLGAACSSGGGSGSDQASFPGTLLEKPGGGLFVVDENRSGKATRLELVEVTWGRAVDVHGLLPNGDVDPTPVFRDWVINENVQTDNTNYLLETNPITLKQRLIVLREPDGPNTGTGTFFSLLELASRGLPPIAPKSDDGTSSPPFSFAARNSCLVLRFNDVLQDDEQAARDLVSTVLVQTGYAPSDPFQPRILFDPNHGAIAKGGFHSTRVLIDLTVSETEAQAMSLPVPVNAIGLPASLSTSPAPNIAIRIPTVTDPIGGQFKLLRGLSGVPLSQIENEPIDRSSRTVDVVRAFRGGNDTDANNGFLLDLNPPRVVGSWPVTVTRAQVDPLGADGFDFVVDVEFTSPCQDSMAEGDILTIGDEFLEVAETTPDPTDDEILGVRVRNLSVDPIPTPGLLFGSGFFQTTYAPASQVQGACWVAFAPQPGVLPSSDVSNKAQAILRFSEPMDPTSVTPFDSFMLLRGTTTSLIQAENVVVGTTAPTPDFKEFTFTPLLPLAHVQTSSELYSVLVGGVTDLAGNQLEDALPPVTFTLVPDEPTERNAGFALRFSDLDEVKPVDVEQGVNDDIRGQIFYDFERGVIKPRAVTFTSYPADRSNPVPAIMIPFPPGLQTPLSSLGSRLMTVWRYADLGWNAADETKHNLDVYGLYWSPATGSVLRDSFEQFEIRLAHSRFQPDEEIDTNLLPNYTNSGLRAGLFDNNVLNDPEAGQVVVHPRELGYEVDPANLTKSVSGTTLMPYPLNRTGQPKLSTFTWRNTAGRLRGGAGGAGVPLDVESGNPLNIVPESQTGTIWSAGQVATAGLPLLMEFRCYPSSEALGLNPLDVSLAINSSAVPNFRSYSTGGVNTNGVTVRVFPDSEASSQGGFNPSNGGRRTRFSADNTFYIGQLDVVTKISRAHTVWVDTLYQDPTYLAPVAIPSPGDQPPGTRVDIDVRGATGFGAGAAGRQFDSVQIDAYGDVFGAQVQGNPPPLIAVDYFPNPLWQRNIRNIDGARYLQLRLTFVNDIDTGLNPELSAVGIAFFE